MEDRSAKKIEEKRAHREPDGLSGEGATLMAYGARNVTISDSRACRKVNRSVRQSSALSSAH
jgi:hypothetical protein